jgi:hypothetical protein
MNGGTSTSSSSSKSSVTGTARLGIRAPVAGCQAVGLDDAGRDGGDPG